MFTRFSVSHRALMAGTSLLMAGAAICAAPLAHADEYLVGALQFAADATGATTSTFYQYDTNSSSGGVTQLDITFQGNTTGKNISLALLNGSNTLSFVQDNVTPISAFGGTTGDLGLFFSSTNTPYNPASGARTPDLLVSRATDGSTAFFFPSAGTSINDYVFPGSTAYGGATSFTLGSTPINVTSYGVDDNGSGTVTVQVGSAVAATPEPGSVALLVGMGVTGAGFAVRRKRRK
jgi:hypothetical protein